MSRIQLLRTDDFTGGLNLRADPFQLADNESPDLLNVDIDPRGGLKVRGGMVKYNSSSVGGHNTWDPKSFFVTHGSTPQVFVAAEGYVYYASSTSFSSTTIAYTAPFGASYAQWASNTSSFVYMATGTTPKKWNGSSATTLTASGAGEWQEDFSNPTGNHMPKARYCASHIDRMWVAYTNEDTNDYPNRIRFSHALFPESWREDDYIDIVEGGSGITAIVPFKENLIVFKKKGIFAIMGYSTDTFQVVPLTQEYGIPNPHAVAVTENEFYFFSWPDGLFMYDGQQFVDLFAQIRPIIQSGEVNSSAQDKVCIASIDHRIWIGLPTLNATKINYSFVYDPSLGQRGAWTRYQTSDAHGIGMGADFVASNGDKFYLGVHPHRGHILKLDLDASVQDDIGHGSGLFNSYYRTKWHDAQNISSKKMWRRPDLVIAQPVEDGKLFVSVYHDWEESLARRNFQIILNDPDTLALEWKETDTEPDGVPGWNEANWGATPSGSQFVRGKNLGLCRSVQLKLEGEPGKPWGVNSITYKFNPRKVRA